MNLYLRKVVHPQAHDNYRVILKLDGDEVEIGSIGIQHGAKWTWGIDTVIPMRTFETQGDGKEREEEAALAARANRSDRDLGLFPLWPSLRTQLGHLPRSESGQLETSPATHPCWKD